MPSAQSATRLSLATVAFVLAAVPAAAGDATFDLNRNVTVGLRGGVMTGTAHEYVYYPSGKRMSELIWDMQHNYTLTADLNYAAGPRWSLYGAATIGFNGNNYMDDYDWLNRPTTDWWTDHSWHDDTGLDHYLALNAHLAYDFLADDALDAKLLGGVKYTDLQWTARGGCYLYSAGGFRDTRGCFTPGQKGITYEQSMPAVYGGGEVGARFGRFGVSARALAGVSISPSDLDTHWMRGLVFADSFDWAPYMGLGASASYRLTDSLGLSLSASYDRYFTAKGSTTINGVRVGGSDDAGASLETLSLSTGLTYAF